MTSGSPFELEDELTRPERQAVAVGQGMLAGELPIHEGAVGGSEVGQNPAPVVQSQLGVAPADVRIGQHNVVTRQAPDRYRWIRDRYSILGLTGVVEDD